MAYVNQSNRGLDLTTSIGSLAAKIGAFASGMADSWRCARIFRETYAELDSLSTRELEDLGLSRSMITRVAYESAYGPQA